MLQEERMDILLNAAYKSGILNTYDFFAGQEGFRECKALTDELVEEKLVRYNDAQKTEIKITNYGRFWVVHGGFLIYLKESERKIRPGRDKHNGELKEELKEARLKFTHYRIVTYWWSFALTLISFLFSLLNLYLILNRT